MIRVADYLISELYKHGVGHVFTVTGRGALFLTDALAAHKSIKTVCTHHEQAAAFAAVAYAQCKEQLGACVVSTGCAGTNTFTGVLNAWQDGVPVVFVSGQNKLAETSHYTGIKLRTYGQQEADLVPMVSHITKYAVMLMNPEKVVFEIGKALYLARQGRQGPVWIDIPLDVQNMRIDPESQEKFIPEKDFALNCEEVPLSDLDYVVECLNRSERPVVLVGSGVRSSQGIAQLDEFISKNSLPTVYSASSPDAVDSGNEMLVGSVGAMACTRAGNFTVQNSDLLLVIGCRMSSMTTGEFCKFGRGSKILVVDIDPYEHSKEGIKIDRLIHADAKVFLTKINKAKIKKTSSQWLTKVQNWKQIFPRCEEKFRNSEKVDLYELAETLSLTMPANTIFHSDSGLIELILPSNIHFKNGQRCVHPASQGSMGAALPSVIGSYFASPTSQILAVIGDGSIMMNLQEFQTISYNKIPAKIIVINNNAYSVIRRRQVELFASRTIGTDSSNGLSCPEFKKIADAFDIGYQFIGSPNELRNGLEALFSTKGPVLCEIMGLENQNYIHSSYTKNLKGRIVNRPIEDQSPFLDREVFLKQMIVEPVDQ